MSATPSVIIGLPVYRPSIEADEEFSFRHLARHLPAYPHAWIAPEGLDLAAFEQRRPGGRIVRFHPDYFRSLHDYSRLLLTEEFYRAFEGFEFLLIHQLDCLVFSDQLAQWTARGDDFIGAPWIIQNGKSHRWSTGNGGFSLRRLEGMRRVLASRKFTHTAPKRMLDQLAHLDRERHVLPNAWLRHWAPISDDADVSPGRWRGANVDDIRRRIFWKIQGGVKAYLDQITYHEDVFWSQVAPVLDPAFRVTPPDIAVRFAFEQEARWCFEKTGGELPFGCHAWHKYDRAFWEPFLLR